MEQSLSAFADWFRQLYGLEKTDIRSYSPLTLAYIGDAVYELVIRSVIVRMANAPVNILHRRSSQLVKAESQCRLIHAIEGELTEEEKQIFKRGRNAKSYTKAKNASLTDYRVATGCEALIGYLFLDEQYERLVYLIRKGLIMPGDKDETQGKGIHIKE